ncbi:MAG: lamin tail domain-containing protein [Patescibacteria group bacterium]
MKKILFLFLIITFLFFAYFAKAQTVKQSDIVINEIAWMGTIVSFNNEWIELKNNVDQNINLDGWTLRAPDGVPEVKLTGIISANSFYLMERTDDDTVLNITADLIYKGALGNKSEDLWLYDNNNNLIDEINYIEEWPAGDNTTKQTMEKSSTGWQTSKDIGGTPRTQNSAGIITDIINLTSNIQNPISDIDYLAGVIFNEILPSPDGTDDGKEWIELYNTNNSEVDLSGWTIKDKEGSVTNYSLPQNTKMPAYGYLTLKRPDTKITLNNTIDGLILSWPDGKVIDFINYENAPSNQSYNKTGANWQWSASLTPGVKNIVVQNNAVQKGTNSSQAREKDLPKIKKSDNSKEVNVGLATINQPINQEVRQLVGKNTNPWFLFIVALLITIASVITVLFIKFKLSKYVRT